MPSRRLFNQLLASAGMATAAGAAQGATRPGGNLTIAFDGAAVTSFVLDPHNGRFAPQARIMRAIYDNLVVLRADQSVGPWLATQWEISPDRRQYIFTLRQDVHFHDGTKFDAAAVKANFDRILNPANALQSLPQIGSYTGATVLSPYVVRLEFAQPFEAFLRNLSAIGLGIVSPAAAAKYGRVFGQNPVGTGPFKFISLTPGQEIRLTKNPDYTWAPSNAVHQGPALLDTLTFTNVPEQLTRVAALQSGQVQGADLIPSQNIAEIRANPQYQFLQKEMLDTTYSFSLNEQKAPWNDFDIRNAVRLSLNLDAIVRIIYRGTIRRAWSPLSPNMFGSAESQLTGSWQPDPEKAKLILDHKGWIPGGDGIRVKNGQRLTISFIDTQGNREQRLDLIQLVRRQLLSIGVALTIDSETAGTYYAKVGNGEFDAGAGAQYAADPDVLRYSFVPAYRAAFENVKVNDKLLNQLLNEAAQEADPTRRAQLYVQAQQRIVDQVYAIPIYILAYNVALAADVQGVTLDAHGFPNYHGAALVNA